MKKICVVSGSRADYGLLSPLLKKIKLSRKLRLQIIATTMHMSQEYGHTYQEIVEDGFEIDECIENLLASNSRTGTAKSAGLAVNMLSDSFERLKPDAVLLLGDRYETHAAATAALLMHVPIIHLHGGELTFGAVDEQLRHAITKMSHLHFTSTEEYRRRVIQMGEEPSSVINCGAPGLDNVVSVKLKSLAQLEKELSWSFGEKTVLFTFHPETVNRTTCSNIRILQSLLRQVKEYPHDLSVIFTYSNADCGGSELNKEIVDFVSLDSNKYHVVKSFGRSGYLSILNQVDVVVGNSSSGIIEAASFKKPVINIGNRQDGRLRNENVIDCEVNELKKALSTAFSAEFIETCRNVKNIYGKGNASDIIVEMLENRKISFVKMFHDIEYG